MNRTSSGLALLAAGGIMLLAVVIPGAPLSIKIVGLFLAAAGLARLRMPRRAAEWLRQNSDRLIEVVDPSAEEVAQTPRVPLDELLTPQRPGEGGLADTLHLRVRDNGTADTLDPTAGNRTQDG
jgi:hypothetical protein